MKRAIGVFLVVAPFVGIAVGCYMVAGIEPVLVAFGATALMTASIWFGIGLLK